MNTNRDYLPQSDKGLLGWINKFLKYLMSRVTKFNFPQAEYDQLSQERDVYAQKLEVATESATRTSLTLEFDEPDRGKTVYFCLRWENTRGQKGPWSPIQKAIIP
jgi:hypothetical protein